MNKLTKAERALVVHALRSNAAEDRDRAADTLKGCPRSETLNMIAAVFAAQADTQELLADKIEGME